VLLHEHFGGSESFIAFVLFLLAVFKANCYCTAVDLSFQLLMQNTNE
jgi:hypothetical protein